MSQKRIGRNDMASQSCPSCGSKALSTESHCQSCGTSLEDAQASTEQSNQLSISHKIGKSYIRQAIEIFILVGVGLGLTGIVVINQIGGGTEGVFSFSGVFISSIVLGVALFFGPVLALVVSFSLANQATRKGTTYQMCFISNAAGHLLMMLTVMFVLTVGAGLGGSGAGTGIGSGNLFEANLLRIVFLSIPTGLIGVGGAYLSDS